MNLAEDLTALLHDPDTGRPIVDSTSLTRAIGGALLLDLCTADRVVPESDGPRAKLTVTDRSPTGEPLTDLALSRLPARPVGARKAVEALARKTREPVLDRLVGRGLVRRERRKVLGLFPFTRFPAADRDHVARLRSRLVDALVGEAKPDEHLALLVSLLYAVRAEHRLVDGPRRQVRARAKQIADGEWAGVAVRKAVRSVQAGVAAAAGSSGSS